MRHVLTSGQFDKDTLGDVFERADFFRRQHDDKLVGRRSVTKIHQGWAMETLFFQPSTRTRSSFEHAAQRLGMSVVSNANAKEDSSAQKGESFEDTIRTLDGRTDIIVIRHPQEHSAELAAGIAENASVINAGDGGNEHPTQAALDVYAIREFKEAPEGLRVAFGGDLRYGRTVRSLVDILSRVYDGNSFSFIAPQPLQVSQDITANLDERGDEYTITGDLREGLAGADVVYWTRVQAENIKDEQEKRKVEAAVQKAVNSGNYVLDRSVLRFMQPDAVIMHPLPRRIEISTELDDSKHLKIFDQANLGIPVRQALLDMLIEDLSDGGYQFKNE